MPKYTVESYRKNPTICLLGLPYDLIQKIEKAKEQIKKQYALWVFLREDIDVKIRWAAEGKVNYFPLPKIDKIFPVDKEDIVERAIFKRIDSLFLSTNDMDANFNLERQGLEYPIDKINDLYEFRILKRY